MLALLRTARWQGFTAVVIIAIIAFGLLSRWQWDRAEEKQAEQRALAVSETEPITPSLLEPIAEFTPVSFTGTYDPDSIRFVRQRPFEGRNGFWVMQQLLTAQGGVWVLRGWTPAGLRAGDSPQLDPASPGTTTIEGVVRPLATGQELDPTDRGGLPLDQVTEIATAQLPPATADQWYVQALTTDPTESLTPVPLTQPDDLQNISYAIQWLLFAAVAIGGWFFFLRREARDAAE